MKLSASGSRALFAGKLKPYSPLLVFLVTTLLVGVAYYSSFRKIESMIQEEELNNLGAISEMKAGQIASWRDTQRRLVEAYSHDSILAVEFDGWLREGAPSNEHKQRLRKLLTELQFVNRFKSVTLVDRQGRVRMSYQDGHVLDFADTLLAARAMSAREEVFSDLHREDVGDEVSLELFAPLIVADGNSSRVAGALVLQIDPYEYLYPLVQTWPTPSASGEVLLVERDGDEVLFLSDGRNMKGTALNLRMPLDSPNLPDAMGIRGVRMTTEGVDYRNAKVVAQMRQVAGMPWFVVSKVDRRELFAPLIWLEQWSTGLGLAYVIGGGMVMFFWLQGYRSRYQRLKEQHAAAVEREMLVKHYEYLSKFANDIILVSDDKGNIIDANERALQSYGYTREEILYLGSFGLRDPDEDPEVLRTQMEALNRLGELRYEAVGMRKDGTRFPMEISARFIEVRGVRYLQEIVRDIGERKRAENELRKSEALLKASQQMAHIGSWEVDLATYQVYWSEESHRIFEYDPALGPVSYRAALDILHPDDRVMMDETYTDSVKNKKPYTCVFRLLFADGRIKYVRGWGETFYDETGRPLRSIGTNQDVTEQQIAQNALRRSAEEIEDLYNNAPCGYHSLDKDGLIIRVNDTLLRWLGYTREELVGKVNIAALFSVQDREVFQRRYAAFKERGYVHDVEYEFVRKDGSLLPVSLSSTAACDAGGNYLMSRSVTVDISARKQAENKLSESEIRFRTMADNAPIMIWMADAIKGTSYQGCNFFNQRWHEFTGLTLEEAEGCNWLARVHPDDRKLCSDSYRDAFGEIKPFKVEYRLRRHDGAFRWIEDSGVPRHAAGNEFLGFIGTSTDISERKLYETMRAEIEHLDRLSIAGEMASGLAHELSQPLAAANNYLKACLRRMQDNDWDQAGLESTVGRAHEQTIRAGQIVGHLKEMIRTQKPEHTLLDINAVIADSIKYLEHELQHHAIAVSLDVSALPPISANKIEIEQVLINLMKNAIDSMCAAPQRELRISTRALESGAVLVTVSDTGVGVAPGEIDTIFNPFHTSKKDGLGLGLAICRSLVENYGGKIWAEQNEGAGTELNFTLAGRGV